MTVTLASVLAIALSGAALAEVRATARSRERGESRERRERMKRNRPVPILLQDGGGRAVGTAVMSGSSSGILFKLSLRNMPPGEHAVMLHETGRCEAPDFQSAGGQLEDPWTSVAGEASDSEAGDPIAAVASCVAEAGDRPRVSLELDDVTADATGHVHTTVMLSGASMRGMLVEGDGSALVIYAGADPSLDGSDRIACGVIGGAAGQPKP